MEQELLIGVDGGGTHSTAVATHPDGRVVAVARGEGLNFLNIGVPAARVRLEKLLCALQDRCKQAPIRQVCVGISALDATADASTVSLFAIGGLKAEQLDLQSDAYIALMGLTLGGPGLIAICGTGSMLLMMDGNGQQHISGGWGYLLRDAGSGYALAREGLLAVIDQAEGMGPKTALTEDAMRYFRVDSIRQLIERIYAPQFTPDRLAGFGRWVLQEAERGDAPARAILQRNMERLAGQACRLMQGRPEVRRAGLYGGIFRHSALASAWFAEALRRLQPGAETMAPEYPPELGAVIHLHRKRGTCNAQILRTLKSTYEEICHECD